MLARCKTLIEVIAADRELRRHEERIEGLDAELTSLCALIRAAGCRATTSLQMDHAGRPTHRSDLPCIVYTVPKVPDPELTYFQTVEETPSENADLGDRLFILGRVRRTAAIRDLARAKQEYEEKVSRLLGRPMKVVF